MVGIYRMIPGIEPICQMLEETDFDRTDLFPLGEWISAISAMQYIIWMTDE